MQVLYLTDGSWYDAVISTRRKADMAYGVYFPESADGEWAEWAEWVTVRPPAAHSRRECPQTLWTFPTAAVSWRAYGPQPQNPIENPYCSCKLARHGPQPQ